MAFFEVDKVGSPYGRKATAAYSVQTSARSQFPKQHVHIPLHKYLKAEQEMANKDK